MHDSTIAVKRLNVFFCIKTFSNIYPVGHRFRNFYRLLQFDLAIMGLEFLSQSASQFNSVVEKKRSHKYLKNSLTTEDLKSRGN